MIRKLAAVIVATIERGNFEIADPIKTATPIFAITADAIPGMIGVVR